MYVLYIHIRIYVCNLYTYTYVQGIYIYTPAIDYVFCKVSKPGHVIGSKGLGHSKIPQRWLGMTCGFNSLRCLIPTKGISIHQVHLQYLMMVTYCLWLYVLYHEYLFISWGGSFSWLGSSSVPKMGGILVGVHGVTSLGRAILAIDKDPNLAIWVISPTFLMEWLSAQTQFPSLKSTVFVRESLLQSPCSMVKLYRLHKCPFFRCLQSLESLPKKLIKSS